MKWEYAHYASTRSKTGNCTQYINVNSSYDPLHHMTRGNQFGHNIRNGG